MLQCWLELCGFFGCIVECIVLWCIATTEISTNSSETADSITIDSDEDCKDAELAPVVCDTDTADMEATVDKDIALDHCDSAIAASYVLRRCHRISH